MKIFLSAHGPDLAAQADPRFGRAAYFIHFNSDTGAWSALPNPAVSHSGGAGVAAAQLVSDSQADAAISGDFGPNAARALDAAGIKMYCFEDQGHSVQAVLDAFQRGELTQFNQ